MRTRMLHVLLGLLLFATSACGAGGVASSAGESAATGGSGDGGGPAGGSDGAGGGAATLDDLLERASDVQEPVPMVDTPGEPTESETPPSGTSETIGNRIGTDRWAPPGAEANVLNWHGFPSETVPEVGSIWSDPAGPTGLRQGCSGTVVARSLVLTAAHCLYNKKSGQFDADVSFVPGQTWNDPQSTSPADITAPNGVWEAREWWVPEGYRDGSVDLDWGLIEIEPQGGRHIGDVVGAFPIQTGISFGGARIWSTGYPAMGWWATTDGRLGRGQYSCDTTWHGGWQNYAGGAQLWITCPMNGGASGGPWFVELNTGEWVIGGVNNWCNDEITTDDEPGTYCTPTSTHVRSLVFDERFLSFWNAVQPLLAS